MASLLEYPAVGGRPAGDGMVRRADGLLHYPALTASLTERLDVAVHRFASRTAVVDPGAGCRMTYGELWASAARIAGGLLEQGVGIGDRVAIRLPNGVRWVQGFLGALLAGAVPVPIHPGLAAAQARHIVTHSGSLLVLDGTFPSGTPFIDDGAAPDDPALLFYTGGTTGSPKGVELSHENVLSVVEAVVRARDATDGRDGDGVRHAVAVPLGSANVCVAQLLPVLVSGGTVVLPSGVDAEALMSVLEAEGVQQMSAPAPLYRSLARDPRVTGDSLRLVLLDDEVLSPATLRRLRDRFPAAELESRWAMTETGGAGLVRSETSAVADVPAPHGGMEFAVEPVADRSGAGELWCRGPSVMRGYWHDPVATARSTAGGWLHTGDVVRVAPSGAVRLVGRAADAVEIPRGVVYSREVEDVVTACPGVAEAAALGVMTSRGPDLGVVVVPEPGTDLHPDAVRDFLDGPLGHRLPRRLCVSAPALPRTATGRVDRTSVRAWLEGSCSRTGSTSTADSTSTNKSTKGHIDVG